MKILKYSLVLLLSSVFLAEISFAQELQYYTETFTIKKEGLSSWKKQSDSCTYAIASARRRAIRQCEESKVESGENKGEKIWGDYIKPAKEDKLKFESCIECYETKTLKNWRCTGRVTVQCKRVRMVESGGVINQLLEGLRDNSGKGDSPCTENSETTECKQYKNSTKAVGGERN